MATKLYQKFVEATSSYQHTLTSDARSKGGVFYTPLKETKDVVLPPLGLLFKRCWEDSDGRVDKYVSEILSLKICDPAMGCGNLLFFAALEIASEIAWVREKGQPRDFRLYEPRLRELEYPSEAMIQAEMRSILERCINGVDLDKDALETFRFGVKDVLGEDVQSKISVGDSISGFLHEDDVKASLHKHYGIPFDDGTQLPFFDTQKTLNDLEITNPLANLAYLLDAKYLTTQDVPSVFDFDSSFIEEVIKEHNPYHWFLHEKQFDLLIMNPPFLGHWKIKTNLGEKKQNHLTNKWVSKRNPDLCSFFFLLASNLVNNKGMFSVVCTNSMFQCPNRMIAVEPILSLGFSILRAVPSEVWSEDANVTISFAVFTKVKNINKTLIKNGEIKEVPYISSYLDEYMGIELTRLTSSHQDTSGTEGGVILRGNFSLHRQLNQDLHESVSEVPETERDALAHFYTCKDLYQNRIPTPSDVVIDFYEPLKREKLVAEESTVQRNYLEQNYPVLFNQLQTRNPCKEETPSVKESRCSTKKTDSRSLKDKDFWWLFSEYRNGDVYKQDYIDVFGRHIKTWTSVRVIKGNGDSLRKHFSNSSYIVTEKSLSFLGIISSFPFEMLVRRLCSTIGTILRFTPTEVFPYFPYPWKPFFNEKGSLTNFPVPENDLKINQIGIITQEIIDLRTSLLTEPNEHGIKPTKTNWGPTKLYNMYDDPSSQGEAINNLRSKHITLTDAVLRAYGWEDLADRIEWIFDKPWIDGYNRYVPKSEYRMEILERIYQLNQERYEYEQHLLREVE